VVDHWGLGMPDPICIPIHFGPESMEEIEEQQGQIENLKSKLPN
jgi:hypothetical protein